MDDLNPPDFAVPEPYFDPVRVEQGLREEVLDDASSLFPCGLVLFDDDGNVCSTRHVSSVPSIHETYPLSRPRQHFRPDYISR